MASASDHRAHAALQPADCLIRLPQRLPAAVETSIGPAHYPAECTQSDAFLQPSLRARYGRANSNSFEDMRSCGAGVIHVGGEGKYLDGNGVEHGKINDNVLIEIGAAMALYGKKVVLLVGKDVTLPSNLQGLYRCDF